MIAASSISLLRRKKLSLRELDQMEISSEKTNLVLIPNSVRRTFGAIASTRIDVVLQLLEVA
jgi:hypothetical protein